MIGLSLQDFCRTTPEEFYEISKAYHDQRSVIEQNKWERMRMHATITIQPHLKHKMTPQKLLPFPWEKKDRKPKGRRVSKEEDRRRFEELLLREKQQQPGNG